MTCGYFITFEGGEGTGKTTQIRRLAAHLETLGHTVVVTREPGGTPVAEAARRVLLDPELEPDGLTELFLLEAARRDHVERVVVPALERGEVVISDRFADSSTVYQGMVRGLGEELVIQLNRLATSDLEPDLTVVFDLDPEHGVGRARSRNADGGSVESRLDDEPVEFHRRVRDGFVRLADLFPDRVRVIDASGDPDEVFQRLLAVLPAALR
ncbi:MAG: dTMP kinase [Holophagae bacterium]|jgi:dTMP kinase